MGGFPVVGGYPVRYVSDLLQNFYHIGKLEASAPKLFFGLLESLAYMLWGLSSVGKLLEDGAQHDCGGLFLLGKEIAVEPHYRNISPRGLITQVIDHQGAII